MEISENRTINTKIYHSNMICPSSIFYWAHSVNSIEILQIAANVTKKTVKLRGIFIVQKFSVTHGFYTTEMIIFGSSIAIKIKFPNFRFTTRSFLGGCQVSVYPAASIFRNFYPKDVNRMFLQNIRNTILQIFIP